MLIESILEFLLKLCTFLKVRKVSDVSLNYLEIMVTLPIFTHFLESELPRYDVNERF